MVDEWGLLVRMGYGCYLALLSEDTLFLGSVAQITLHGVPPERVAIRFALCWQYDPADEVWSPAPSAETILPPSFSVEVPITREETRWVFYLLDQGVRAVLYQRGTPLGELTPDKLRADLAQAGAA